MLLSRLALVCLLLSAVVSGCIFNPIKDKGPGPPPPLPTYPILSSPEEVLRAMRLAYEARDTVEYKLLYDERYQGTSLDQSNPGSPKQDTFTKSDEVEHVAALAKAFTITSIFFDLPALPRSTDLSDPPGWATIQIGSGARIQINDTGTTYNLPSTNETLEFRFIPTTPDSTSPTDTTWKVVKWLEIYSGKPL